MMIRQIYQFSGYEVEDDIDEYLLPSLFEIKEQIYMRIRSLEEEASEYPSRKKSKKEREIKECHNLYSFISRMENDHVADEIQITNIHAKLELACLNWRIALNSSLD